ncbi:MAG: hypothetical protein ABJM43_13815 [Paracoccaceae bacterium]
MLPLSAIAETPIVMRTLDVTASFPAPPWTVIARIARETESNWTRALSDSGTDVLVRTYVPKGENFEDWSELYGVKAETPLLGSATGHRDHAARQYQKACQNAVLAPIVQSEERQVFILLCPSFMETPDIGEFAVMVFSKQEETLLKVFYQRRVPAFDLANQSSLPSTEAEMKTLVQYLNQAHLVPS